MARLAFGLLLLGTACSGRTIFSRPRPSTADSVYSIALGFLVSGNRTELDSAAKYLDLYVAMPRADRSAEAAIMRRLVRDAQQLGRVEAALNQARAQSTETKAEPRPAETKIKEDEALKEIQRLKDELAKANEELERIRKRLANPKPLDY
jgi:hypothetical protein